MNTIKTNLLGLKKYKSVLYELVSRDIKVRYRGSFLGMLWTLLHPILTMLVMTLIFSNLFRSEIENFTIYFFTGNILFTLMSESTTNAMHSINDNGNLIKKVYLPKYLLPVSKILSSMINMLFAFVAMLFIMLVTGTKFYVTLLLSPIAMLYTILFSMGIGLLLAVIMVFFKDMSQLYTVITMLWMYLTPIFYPISLLEENAPIVLKINPMYHYVHYFRTLVLDGKIPGIEENLICFGMAAAALIIGLYFFYKKQDKFILHI